MYIFTHQTQQSHLKDMLEKTSSQTKEVRAKQEQSDLLVKQKNQQESNLIEQLKRIASEKEQKVHQLEEEIRQMKNRVNIMAASLNLEIITDHRLQKEILKKCKRLLLTVKSCDRNM